MLLPAWTQQHQRNAVHFGGPDLTVPRSQEAKSAAPLRDQLSRIDSVQSIPGFRFDRSDTNLDEPNDDVQDPAAISEAQQVHRSVSAAVRLNNGNCRDHADLQQQSLTHS